MYTYLKTESVRTSVVSYYSELQICIDRAHWLILMQNILVMIEGPKVIKPFSCSTQLSMKVFLLINIKMPTIVGILTVMSGKNSILGLSESKKDTFLDIFILISILKFHAQLS